MTQLYNQGIVNYFGIQSDYEVINDVTQLAVSMFVPETPLLALLMGPGKEVQVPGSVVFSWLNSLYRPRSLTFAGTTETTAGTGSYDLTLADASMLMVGDVLRHTTTAAATEDMEVTVVKSATVVTVKRGVAGTTAAILTNNDTVTLVSNSRTGAEIDQDGIRRIRTKVDQICQTWQFPVQVGGSANSTRNIVLPPGVSDLFSADQIEALRNMKRDMEYSTCYGNPEAPSAGGRPKQAGVRALCTTNRKTATNPTAYKRIDFINDGIQACRDHGGDPNLCLVSTGFLSGLATWGLRGEFVPVGTTFLGSPIEALKVPFLAGNVYFLESQQIGGPGNAVAFLANIDEMAWMQKRPIFWQPRGNRGDAREGDYIAEGAVKLENEFHHAWIEGISGFSAA